MDKVCDVCRRPYFFKETNVRMYKCTNVRIALTDSGGKGGVRTFDLFLQPDEE
jgi:hypothetical protein